VGSHDIWVMDAHGSHAEPVFTRPEDDTWPAWSPDGTRIAFVSSRITNVTGGTISIVAPDGSSFTRLVVLPFAANFPAWGPTDRIAVMSDAGDLWTVAPDGSHLVEVTETPARDFAAAWSPDGRVLAFPSERWEERP
jgi:Tol biopolymer transport system component